MGLGGSCAAPRAGHDDPGGSFSSSGYTADSCKENTHRAWGREGRKERGREGAAQLLYSPLPSPSPTHHTHTHGRQSAALPPQPGGNAGGSRITQPGSHRNKKGEGVGRRPRPRRDQARTVPHGPRSASGATLPTGQRSRTQHPAALTGSHQDPPRAAAPSSPSSSSSRLPYPPPSPRVLCGRRLFPQRYLL